MTEEAECLTGHGPSQKLDDHVMKCVFVLTARVSKHALNDELTSACTEMRVGEQSSKRQLIT